MTTYKHIVQVHPVENGEPNLNKVRDEQEFDTLEEAQKCVEDYNRWAPISMIAKKAVYRGRVNDATGELE